MSTYLNNFTNWFNQFTSGQKLYLTSLLIFVIMLFSDEDKTNLWVISGCIALAALAVELWPNFIRTWNTFLGRIIILVTYAIMANLAIAQAYQELNRIVGIDPSPLFYSLGFVTLLMAPVYILAITLLVMMLVMIWQQIVLIINLVFKLIRLKSIRINSQIKHPTTTAFVKMVLIPGMFAAIIGALDVYGNNINFGGANLGITCTDDGKVVDCPEDAPKTYTDLASRINQEMKEEFDDKPRDKKVETAVTLGGSENSAQALPTEGSKDSDKNKTANRMAYATAKFVYDYELFANTQCIQAPGEKVMFIGEFDIFVGKPNKQSPTGFDFYVRNCILKNYD